jgi:hypothetical protein
MFVIPCRFEPTRPVVFDCVYRIRKHHPDAEILVVDSASNDTGYADVLRPLGIAVDLAGNTNYEVGALWHAYERYPREHYFLLQDTALVKDNLDDLRRHEASGMMYWDDWSGCSPCHVDWAREHIAACDYPFLETGFKMVFGCMLFARRTLLDRFRAKRLHRVLPTDKVGSCAMERILGLALEHEGLGSSVPQTFLSEWVGINDDQDGKRFTRTPRLDKVWFGRA